MPEEKPGYQSYLLRLWQVKSDHQTTWRASLEPVGTGKSQSFSSLDALFAFLVKETHERSADTAPS